MRSLTIAAGLAIILAACASAPRTFAERVADACNGLSHTMSLMADARRLGRLPDGAWDVVRDVRATAGAQCEEQASINTASALAFIEGQLDRLIEERAKHGEQ